MTVQSLFRVYADSNDRDADGNYFLFFEQSKFDLAAIGDNLREGLTVVLNDQGDGEVHAVLFFNADLDCWMGRPDYSTWRDLDETRA